jgi:hypothetical protein
MKDLDLDMQNAKENKTACLYSYLKTLNGRNHPVDLDIDINIILSALYNILKNRTRGWPNEVRWPTTRKGKNYLSAFLKGRIYFGYHRTTEFTKEHFSLSCMLVCFLILYNMYTHTYT